MIKLQPLINFEMDTLIKNIDKLLFIFLYLFTYIRKIQYYNRLP
jgi:hypothetical protein